MQYTEAILWYLSWPVVIYIAYRFVLINMKHHAKMERLEMLEEKFGDQCTQHDPMLSLNKKEKDQ